MFRFKFLGKTNVPHLKATANTEPLRMPAPKELLLPMSQHRGAPAIPAVKVGDTVKVGQLIAEANGYVSSPIYSPVSGKITKIESYLAPNGNKCEAVRIENDGLMTLDESITPPEINDLDSLIQAVRASGVVGLGGAGFPTAVKLDAAKKNEIHTVLINGAECEPYLTSDARTMVDDSVSVFEGVSLLKKCLPDVSRIIFGIETNKPEAISELSRVFQDDETVSILPLPPYYPQGAEKVLIYNALDIVIPENKLPAECGVIVMNVTTLAAIAKYAKTGMPLVERCISVDGGAIKEPKNVIAPIGVSVGEIIKFAGGFKEDAAKIILGGPMTGSAIFSLDEPVIKTTGAIIGFTEKEAAMPKETACIHCGKCVEVCPQLLNPTAFSKILNLDVLDEKIERLDNSRVLLCVECGSCSFVCPANRPLLDNIRVAKNTLREYKAHTANLK